MLAQQANTIRLYVPPIFTAVLPAMRATRLDHFDRRHAPHQCRICWVCAHAITLARPSAADPIPSLRALWSG